MAQCQQMCSARGANASVPWRDKLIKNHDGDTYRAIVTVRLEGAIYVLHAFKKKSKHGIGMTRQDQGPVAARLREAVADHEERRKLT